MGAFIKILLILLVLFFVALCVLKQVMRKSGKAHEAEAAKPSSAAAGPSNDHALDAVYPQDVPANAAAGYAATPAALINNAAHAQPLPPPPAYSGHVQQPYGAGPPQQSPYGQQPPQHHMQMPYGGGNIAPQPTGSSIHSYGGAPNQGYAAPAGYLAPQPQYGQPPAHLGPQHTGSSLGGHGVATHVSGGSAYGYPAQGAPPTSMPAGPGYHQQHQFTGPLPTPYGAPVPQQQQMPGGAPIVPYPTSDYGGAAPVGAYPGQQQQQQQQAQQGQHMRYPGA
ncbi:hypothetical protein H9P43_002266 [Blastocladiella emersonii ATCC 22665]|nr:hypothetical protein H9P43_002266 [Blastocladiella emersonii ATCC 22665]